MRFPVNPEGASVGTWRGWGKIFLLRARRRVGLDRSERLHSSVGAAPQVKATGWQNLAQPARSPSRRIGTP
jgi:hypothetical protein